MSARTDVKDGKINIKGEEMNAEKGSIEELTEQNFYSAITGKKVLVDCYAEWCGPCQMLSPIIEELAEEITDWKFCKLNIDDESEIAEKHEVMSIPTLLLFENGELKNTLVGLQSKDALKKILAEK